MGAQPGPRSRPSVPPLLLHPEDRDRSLDLSSKANAGEADERELAELADLVAANDTLMLLQSKARLSLRASGLPEPAD